MYLRIRTTLSTSRKAIRTRIVPAFQWTQRITRWRKRIAESKHLETDENHQQCPWQDEQESDEIYFNELKHLDIYNSITLLKNIDKLSEKTKYLYFHHFDSGYDYAPRGTIDMPRAAHPEFHAQAQRLLIFVGIASHVVTQLEHKRLYRSDSVPPIWVPGPRSLQNATNYGIMEILPRVDVLDRLEDLDAQTKTTSLVSEHLTLDVSTVASDTATTSSSESDSGSEQNSSAFWAWNFRPVSRADAGSDDMARRLNRGMARKKQVDLIKFVLEVCIMNDIKSYVWRYSQLSFLHSFPMPSGPSENQWDEETERQFTADMIASLKLLKFFMKIRSESIESRIWKYVYEE